MIDQACNLRVPPHDIPAEASVLGAMMVYSQAVPTASEILAENDFYRPAHQLIFRVLCYMADHPARFGPPDLVTIRAALQSRGRLAEIGGVEYLVALANGVPSAANVEHYAEIVKDKSRRRELIVASTTTVNAAFGTGSTADILTNATLAVAAAGNHSRKPSQTSSADVRARIESAIAGQRVSISWPWRSVTRYANPCAPGAVTILCGEPGSGKSLAFQEAMLAWHQQGIPTAILHLEKNREYHQIRALAQLAGESSLTSDQWQRANPKEARMAEEEYRDVLNSYGATVFDDPDGSMTLEQVQTWMAARATEGARVVGVDPITAAASGPKPWEDDRRFIVACQAMAARHNCSVVLVTHPRNITGTAPNMDQLAGGRAYSRLTDCVLWLQGHNPPEDGKITYACGEVGGEYNRSIALCKTRDGAGQGIIVAIAFDGATLRTTELGPIQSKKKRKRAEQDYE